MVTRSRRVGRPRSTAAGSHAAIMDAVHTLLQQTSVRDLTMEAVARQAGVGKPTLYKWWPSKAALVFAMFHERLAQEALPSQAGSAEAALRERVRGLVRALNGLFGKVMAELIAEGQSDPAVLKDLYERHVSARREVTRAEIERGKAQGELAPDVDPELLMDELFGAVYYRHLLRSGPLTEEYADRLVDQALRGLRALAPRS